MIGDFFNTPVITTDKKATDLPEGLQFFVNYLCSLEGAKTKIKNLHWAAKRLPLIDKRGNHIYLDSFLAVVSDFQDTVAECSQGILGDMNVDSIKPVQVLSSTPIGVVGWLIDKTTQFYENIPLGTIYVGIKSETESFIRDLTKYKYLFNITE